MSCVNYVQALMNDAPDSWEATLTSELSIDIVRDARFASLKYDQRESPMHEAIVQQCRGMVVDMERRQVVAWPYDKFWNHGEELAAEIDWRTARVQEKIDGSLMILFHHDGWCVASSGHPTAGGSFGSDVRTFRDAFWRLIEQLDVRYQNGDPEVTYMFELCDQPNRVVVRHDKPRLVLHGARVTRTGEYLSRDALSAHAASMNCEIVREFPISSIVECMAAADALDPMQQEGFVVVDGDDRRIKIKSPRYVAIHHMRGEMTVRRAVELWQSGEAAELVAHFPELAASIASVHATLDGIAAQAVVDFSENWPRASRKEFAAAVLDRPWRSILFKMITDGHTLDVAKAIMRRQATASLERLVVP